MFNSKLKEKISELSIKIFNLEDENEELKEKLDSRVDLNYVLGEEKNMRGKEMNDFLRKLALNENAWKFARKSMISIAVSAIGAKGDEWIRITGVIEGMLKWMDIASNQEFDKKDKEKVLFYKKKYLPQKSLK